jgi:hypothetical protein
MRGQPQPMHSPTFAPVAHRFAALLRKHAAALLSVLSCCWLAGCATSAPPEVNTTRAPDFTDERLARGGTVYVVRGPKAAQSGERQSMITGIEEKHFRSKGFTIAPKLDGADYAFYSLGYSAPATSMSDSGDQSVSYSGDYHHNLQAHFLSIRDGKMEQKMWEGTAMTSASGDDPFKVSATLLEAVLSRFPN